MLAPLSTGGYHAKPISSSHRSRVGDNGGRWQQVAPAGDRDNLVPLTIAGGMAEITAQGEGRLAALSARQQLRDEVCIAMADGRITHFERSLILAHAKWILKPEEYAAVQGISRSFVAAAPVAVRHPTKLACGTCRKAGRQRLKSHPRPRRHPSLCGVDRRNGNNRHRSRGVGGPGVVESASCTDGSPNTPCFSASFCGTFTPRGPSCPAGDFWPPL